jgi:predicted RNA-binding Zn-ribbon protein involved in translation (DUF1610 family)
MRWLVAAAAISKKRKKKKSSCPNCGEQKWDKALIGG